MIRQTGRDLYRILPRLRASRRTMGPKWEGSRHIILQLVLVSLPDSSYCHVRRLWGFEMYISARFTVAEYSVVMLFILGVSLLREVYWRLWIVDAFFSRSRDLRWTHWTIGGSGWDRLSIVWFENCDRFC